MQLIPSKIAQKRLNTKSYILIGLIIMVLLSCCVILLHLLSCVILLHFIDNQIDSKALLAKSEVDAVFIVSDHPGIGLDREKLNFGMITPGSSSTKKLTLQPYASEVFVHITMSPEINDSVDVNKNDFVLLPNTTKELSFYLVKTNSLEYGNYSGLVYISYYSVE